MTSAPGKETSSHRACVDCRGQKVRCIMDDSKSDVCQRCERIGRPCIFPSSYRRKQRVRTDTRVAELELEMRNMRSLLKSHQQEGLPILSIPHDIGRAQDMLANASYGARSLSGASTQATCHIPTSSPQTSTTAAGYGAYEPVSSQYMQSKHPPGLVSNPQASTLDKTGDDVVSRGVLSMATARQLVEIYRKDMFPVYPVVALSPSITPDELRQTRPVLFLAVIAAGAYKMDPVLSAVLDQEVLETYAKRCLLQSEKSLELVQSLLISILWYHAPIRITQMKYNDYIRMAVTMATEIGLSTKSSRPQHGRVRRTADDSRGRVVIKKSFADPGTGRAHRSRDSSPNAGNDESRRTLIGCYIISTIGAMSVRRPKDLRVSRYVRDCLDVLQHSPMAVSTDSTLVAWARLVMIADEITTSLSYDDVGSLTHISDLKTRFMLKDFARRLALWSASVPEKDMTPSLTMMYYYIRSYLHEIALYIDHAPEDFKAPYHMGAVQSSDGEEDNTPTSVLADAITECVTCCHALLDTFLAMDTDGLRAAPVGTYFRVSYATFVMAKLCLSASQPDSRIGNLLSGRNLNAQSYLDRLIMHLRNVTAIGTQKCRVPTILLTLLYKIRQWCINPLMIEDRTGYGTSLAIEYPLPTARRGPPDMSSFTEQIRSASDDYSQTLADLQPAGEFNYVFGVQRAAFPQVASPGVDCPLSIHRSYNYGNQSGSASFERPTDSLSQDQMQLDDGFLPYLGDMSAYAEGDWMSNDPEVVNWYAALDNEGGSAALW